MATWRALGDIGRALGGADVVGADAEGAGDLVDDLLHGKRGRLIVVEDIADGRLRRAQTGFSPASR